MEQIYLSVNFLPARDHGSRLIEIISLMIDRPPAGGHNGWRGIKEVFFACFWIPPANCSSAVFIVICPLFIEWLPSSQQLAAFVKSVIVSVYEVSATYKVFAIIFSAFGGSKFIELRTIFLLPVSCIIEVGGDAVEYCNPYDIESIENAIEKVVLNDNYRRELEKRALIQAAKFSYNKAAEETLKIYSMFK